MRAVSVPHNITVCLLGHLMQAIVGQSLALLHEYKTDIPVPNCEVAGTLDANNGCTVHQASTCADSDIPVTNTPSPL